MMKISNDLRIVAKIVLFFLSASSYSQTYVDSIVSGLWEKENSPYIVSGNLLVPKDSVLHINPGIEVLFDGPYEFRVEGILNCIGDANNIIVFGVSENTSYWNGFTFFNGDSISTFKYCQIEKAEKLYTEIIDGAAIHCNGTNLRIYNSTIKENSCISNGGAIYAINSNLEIYSSTVSNNNSQYNGGGIYCEETNITIQNTTITDNLASWGGGIFLSNSNSKISGLILHANIGEVKGAGISVYKSNAIISNSVFEVNMVNVNGGYGGGALYVEQGSFCAINGSKFINNESISKYSILGASKSDVYFNNCVFFQDYVIESNNYSSIGSMYGSNVGISNSIITNTSFYTYKEGTVNVNYSNIEGGFDGIGNIDGPTGFVDPSNADFSLLSTSACVDKGNPDILYNDFDGSRNDMGCFGGQGLFLISSVFDFGTFDISEQQTDNIHIFNFQDTDIEITEMISSSPDVIVDTVFPVIVEPMNSVSVPILLTPTVSGDFSSYIDVYSPAFNDLTSLILVEAFVGQNINAKGKWEKKDSPIYISGDVTIDENNKLEIEPGVEVIFLSDFSITVYGSLEAVGTVSDSIVFSKSNEIDGWGGIRFERSTNHQVLEYCKIEYAKTSGNGGAISSLAQKLSIKNSLLQHNEAHMGAAIHTDNCLLELNNTTFRNNKAVGSGGAVNTYLNQVLVHQCHFENNTSEEGAVFNIINGELKISNSTLFHNSGIESITNLDHSTGYLVNTVISKNSVSKNQPYLLKGGTYNIYNSIIWNNTFEYRELNGINGELNIRSSIINQVNWPYIYGQAKVEYSLISGGYPGVGIIDTDPLFVDADNFDFRLLSSSPCINAGIPYSLYNDTDGSQNDMGIFGGCGLISDRQFDIDFGLCGIGQELTEQIVLHNFNQAEVNIINTKDGNSRNYTKIDESYTIDPMGETSIDITFHPKDTGVLLNSYNLISENFYGIDTIVIHTKGIGGIWSGIVSGEWTKENSPYIISRSIIIPANEKLSIQPGVVIQITTDFEEEIQIHVEGTLEAIGNKTDSILFTSKNNSLWNGIVVGEENRAAQCNLRYCIVENATIGISVQSDSCLIDSCRISNNVTGVEFLASNYSFFGELSNSVISNNGWGIIVKGICENDNILLNPMISKNNVYANSEGGILVNASGENPISWIESKDTATVNPVISGNRIYNNNGPAIITVGVGSFVQGISSTHTSYGQANPIILRNMLFENNVGISATTNGTDIFGNNIGFAYADLNGNTIVKNEEVQISATNFAEIKLINCIVWDSLKMQQQIENGARLEVSYSNLQRKIVGEGNISLVPLFVDSENNDYNLQYQSPCIDMGNPALFDTDSTISDMGGLYYHQSLSDFSLMVPGDDEGIIVTFPVLGWEQCKPNRNEPITYDVVISPTISFDGGEVIEFNDIDTNNFQVTQELTNLSTYYWKVKAFNPWGMEKWSTNVYSFNINTDTVPFEFITEIPGISIYENESYVMDESFWSPLISIKPWANVQLSFVVKGGSEIMVESQNGNQVIIPKQDWAGIEELELIITDTSGYKISSTFMVEVIPVEAVIEKEISQGFGAMKNYPNPFNHQTTIQFELSENANVSLEIFNTQGKMVYTRKLDRLSNGINNVEWDASEVQTGLYYCKIVCKAENGDESSETIILNKTE